MTNELEHFLIAKQDLKCQKCHSRLDVNSLIKCELVLRNKTHPNTSHIIISCIILHESYIQIICYVPWRIRKWDFWMAVKMTYTGKKHSDVFIYSRGIILLLQTVFSSVLLIKWQLSLENETMENTVSLKPVALFIKPTFFSEVFKLRHKS